MTTTQTENSDLITATAPAALAPALKGKPSNRARWTAAQKAECLARFRESELSQREFAQGRNMSAANLARWLRPERAGGDPPASREEGPLVEVAVAALGGRSPSALPVQIHLSDGLRLEVAPGTDCAWLGRLLNTLAP